LPTITAEAERELMRISREKSARIAELEAAIRELIEAAGNLAMRNEASMAVWRDKLSSDMIQSMEADRNAIFTAVGGLRKLGV